MFILYYIFVLYICFKCIILLKYNINNLQLFQIIVISSTYCIVCFVIVFLCFSINVICLCIGIFIYLIFNVFGLYICFKFIIQLKYKINNILPIIITDFDKYYIICFFIEYSSSGGKGVVAKEGVVAVLIKA